MTIGGILSGVLNPAGSGYLLARIAERSAANAASDPSAVGSAPAQEDRVELSPEAQAASDASAQGSAPSSPPNQVPAATGADSSLSEEEQSEVTDLKQRDTEVRAHEAAHMAAAGGYARGAAQYTYEQGPDGKQYAIGGEVQIDVSAVPDDPEATIRKMETVRAAALAPANPSGQDRSVAAQATVAITEARSESAAQSADSGVFAGRSQGAPRNGESGETKSSSESGNQGNSPRAAQSRVAESVTQTHGASAQAQPASSTAATTSPSIVAYRAQQNAPRQQALQMLAADIDVRA